MKPKYNGFIMKRKLDEIEIQCDTSYAEPFDLVLNSTGDTLVSISVTLKDLKKVHNTIAEFLKELEESRCGKPCYDETESQGVTCGDEQD